MSLLAVSYLGEVFYSVADGNHRAESAKIRGEEEIEAEIIETSVFDPNEWVLTDAGVENRISGKTRDLPVDYRAAAKWLGVKPV